MELANIIVFSFIYGAIMIAYQLKKKQNLSIKFVAYIAFIFNFFAYLLIYKHKHLR